MSTDPIRPAESQAGTTSVGWNRPEEILNQLERLASSVHFRNSKRYPALLRYLVNPSLLGKKDCLKERTLGIEVFGRAVDYDTNADPVVRITAGEVRKRIAQYYQSPDHEHELRLELPLGSYVPHFLPSHAEEHAALHRFTEGPATPILGRVERGHFDSRITDSNQALSEHQLLPISSADAQADDLTDVSRKTPADSIYLRVLFRLRSRRIQAALACGILAMVALCGVLASDVVSKRRQDYGLSSFWGPLLRSKEPAVIVLGVHSFDIHGNDFSPISEAQLPPGEQTALSAMIRSNMVPVSDVVSYSELVSLLTRHSLPFHTQSSAETTIEEFRHGPIILIGGFDNTWTLRLTSSLRFRFVADSDSLHEIQDSEHPHSRWQFDNAQSVSTNARDYAIVARFFDPQIEQHVMVVAGIGKSGTEAAAQFVTDERALQTWIEAAPPGQYDNVEIVLATDVIEGKHGPPHVIASYRW